MTSYVFQNKTDLVNHVFAKLETPSPIKIQKTFYLLFTFYGATYGQLKTNPPTELESINYPTYLFKPNFEAWCYGPVGIDIHKTMNKYEALELTNDSFENSLTPTEIQNILHFIDNIVEQANDMDDFTLIGRVRSDDAWCSVANSNNKAIDPQVIINEYITKYIENDSK